MGRVAGKQECLWLGSAEIGNLLFVAISLNKPKPPDFATASIHFHPIPLKTLDDLYKTAKRIFLRSPHSAKAK